MRCRCFCRVSSAACKGAVMIAKAINMEAMVCMSATTLVCYSPVRGGKYSSSPGNGQARRGAGPDIDAA